MLTLSWPLSILRQGQIWFLRLWNGKHWKSAFSWCGYALYYQNAFKFNLWKLYGSRLFSDLARRSYVHYLPTFSKKFSCETNGPVSIKFNKQPPGKGRKKVHLFVPCHRTKIVDMSIYGKTLLFLFCRIWNGKTDKVHFAFWRFYALWYQTALEFNPFWILEVICSSSANILKAFFSETT